MTSNSVHLQNFPNLDFLDDEKELAKNMDMVRLVCSAALFIRDQKNIRVRLPLNKLTIIGKNAAKMLEFKDIIADEVNVKNIEIAEEIGDLAELKLQINFKKVGAKFGKLMKEISILAKEGKWKKISDNKIEIAGQVLEDDDFEIKLIAKDQDSITSLPSNDCLVKIDLEVTEELRQEGVARDVVRVIQQNRKEADLDISDLIDIEIFSDDRELLKTINNYQDYIKEQTLGKNLKICTEKNQVIGQFNFQNKIEKLEFEIGITSFH